MQKEIPKFLSILRSQRDRKSHYGDRAKDIWLNDPGDLFQPRWSCDIESSEAATSWGKSLLTQPFGGTPGVTGWGILGSCLSCWSIFLSRYVSRLYIFKFTLKEPFKEFNYLWWVITRIRSFLQIQAFFPALHPLIMGNQEKTKQRGKDPDGSVWVLHSQVFQQNRQTNLTGIVKQVQWEPSG